MKPYKEYLKDVTKEVVFCEILRDSFLLHNLVTHGREFFWCILALFVRLLIVLTFPISIPILAYASLKDDEHHEKRMSELKIIIDSHYKGETE